MASSRRFVCFAISPNVLDPEFRRDRIKPHIVAARCPHLNPTERLWELTHRHLTRKKRHPTFKDFNAVMLTFPRGSVTRVQA